MLLKMQELLGFSSFHEAAKDKKIPIKTAYKLAKLASAIEKEISFYQEKLRSIILEYAELDENNLPIQTEDGQGVRIQKGNENKCATAINELMEIEVTLPDIAFTIEEFDNLDLTLVELSYILPFIQE